MSASEIIDKLRTLPYPSRPSKPESVVKEKDFSSRSDYLYALADKTKQYDLEMVEYKAKIKEHTKSYNDLHDEFRKAAINESGLSDMPESVQNAAYSQAYSESHGSGFHDILSTLGDYADLIEKAYYAGYSKGQSERD